MRCPSCNNSDTRVVDTRAGNSGLSVRRRRACEKCNQRFTTGEYLEILDVMVIKRDGRRVAYSRDNIESGVRRSLEKRPHTTDAFDRLMCMIERDIQNKRSREVTTEDIGNIVMKHLRTFDKVAYIRFASVYLNFSDVETFAQAAAAVQTRKKIKA